MTPVELLMSEMHRLADLHVVTLTAYYVAPRDNYEAELDSQSATAFAWRAVAESIATAHAWRKSYVDTLREAMTRNTSPRVNEYLEEVLAKLLALTEHAMPKACDMSSAA
jgi:hypothetical protein